MKPQIDPSHYFSKEYNSKMRFIGYWHQIDGIINLNPNKVLEIGVGNKFVYTNLKERGINIVSLDIDARLNPDVVGSVSSIPFKNNYFDVLACYELLEHLPYKNLPDTLKELFRISRDYVILSLPDVNRIYRIDFQIPKIGVIKKLFTLPRLKKPVHNFDGQHYWEIGKKNYPLKRIIDDIKKARFNIEKTYRIFEFPYFRFFILKK